MTTAPLSARAAALGPRGLNGGSIAGAVVGSVVGALLILLCLPFLLRARRQWRSRHVQHDDAFNAELGQSPSPGGRSSSPPHFSESKRLSSDPAPDSTPGSDSGNGHTNDQHPRSLAPVPHGNNFHLSSAASDQKTQPPPLIPPAGLPIHQGIPSPTSPPLSPTTRPDSLPQVPEYGQAYPTPPADDVLTPKPHHQPTTSTRESTRDLSITDSHAPLSREVAGFTTQGITEEPESFEPTSQSSTHRAFGRVSGSIRDFIRNQRRGSRRSTQGGTDGARSPSESICTTDPFPSQELVQPCFEEADPNARGLAWEYYNNPDLTSEVEIALAQPPQGLVPPVQATSTLPLSPISLPDQQGSLGEAGSSHLITHTVVSEPEALSPDSEDTITPFNRQYSLLRGPGSLTRTDSLPPLQPIVADIPGTFYPSPSGPSGRPMDFMGPSNEVEKSWRVDQEYLKHETPSPPMEAPLVYEYMPHTTPAADPRYVQPVAFSPESIAQAAEPRYVQPHGLSPESVAQAAEPHYVHQSQGLSPESDYQSPPHLALNGQQYNDIDLSIFMDPAPEQHYTPDSYYTPPPSIPSNHNTPDTRVSDYTASPSPRSDIDQRVNGRLDASPGFPCDQCHRSFDQVHKLNHHKRYHDRPHECSHPGCTMRFGTKTHLDRHINDKHKKTRQFHCTEHGCPYSRQGGKSFPRKDNWRRHMVNKHQITPNTEPIEYGDSTMMGT